jgi:hypothetical protein
MTGAVQGSVHRNHASNTERATQVGSSRCRIAAINAVIQIGRP